METEFEDRLDWFAARTLAGKFPRGEIAASTTYAREIIRLRGLLDARRCATVLHMTDTQSPSILAWVDDIPAPSTFKFRRSNAYDALVADLKEHPGQWALVGDGINGVKKSSTEQLRNRGITSKTRTLSGPARDAKGDRLVAVYAAYLPPTDYEPF